MSEWLDGLVSEEIRNPCAKEPEITKVAEQVVTDEYLQNIEDQISVCGRAKAELQHRISAGDIDANVESDLKDVNAMLDELLEIYSLHKSNKTTAAFQVKAEMTAEQLTSAVEAFRLALSTDAMHATDILKRMYPEFSQEEIDKVKEKYWEPIFGGNEKTEGNQEGMMVGADLLGEVLDDVLVLEVKHPEFIDSHVENVFGITNASLKEEIIRRAISTSPDLSHRDPEEVYTITDTQSTGPHADIVPTADAEEKIDVDEPETFISADLGPDVQEDMKSIIESKLGGAIAEQFDAITYGGECLEQQNSNALRILAEFLSKRREHGAGEIAFEINKFLKSWAEASVKEASGEHCPTCPEAMQLHEGRDHAVCSACGVVREVKEAAPKKTDDPAAKQPEAPAAAPQPSEEEVKQMVQRRIELAQKMDALSDQIAKLREAAMSSVVQLSQQVKQEEPILTEALRKIDDMSIVVDGWKQALKTRAGYSRQDTGAILDKVQEIAKEESDRFYKLIAQLRGTEKYNTEVKPSESLELKRVKQSLDIEADVPQRLKEYWSQLKNWFSRFFMPELDQAEKGFNEMSDYLDAFQELA